METAGVIDKDCPFGALFSSIISEMKNCAPLWEELTAKSTKMHSCLRTTLQAISAFLETLQKIADAATSTKGATKDIGTALTRICLRHKALEAKMKTFTSSLMDCLILPLQDRLEDWKKTTVQLDKDHAKEYKRARSELKKRSMETIRLQKKLRKGVSHNGGLSGSFTGGTLPRSGSSINGSDSGSLHSGNRIELNRTLERALRENAEKRQAFEDTEKQAIRNALQEERSRFALFVSYLKPVVDEEVAMLYELTHVQEAMQQLEKHSDNPYSLPPASEQVIADLKGSSENGAWSFHTPPSSPSSLGSRKSSMCSISSANSSSSGSAHSPSHKAHHRTTHHPPLKTGQMPNVRYSSVSSQDSGFTSQDTLFSRHTTAFPPHQAGNQSEGSNNSSTGSSNSSTPSSPYPPGNSTLTTWPNLEDSKQFERAACAIMSDRPHTISSAYERGHQRPPLTVYTFQPPNPNDPGNQESPSTPVVTPIVVENPHPQSLGGGIYQSAAEIYGILRGKVETKPPVPKRCSSLERPNSALDTPIPKPLPKNSKSGKEGKRHHHQNQMQAEKDSINKIYASNVPDFNPSSDDMIVPQPVYVNMHELNQMAKEKRQRQGETDLPPPPPELMGSSNKIELVEPGSVGRGDISMLHSGNNSVYGSQNQPNFGCSGQGEDGSSGRNSSTGLYGHTGGPEGCPSGRLPSSRRNSCSSQEKPPPPVRRNSSITASPSRNSPVPHAQQGHGASSQCHSQNQNHSHNNSPMTMNNYQSSAPKHTTLPQTPIYIQNPTYSHNGSLASISQGSSSVDSGETTPHASMESLPPPPAYLVGPNGDRKSSSASPLSSGEDNNAKRTASVAETVKTLTDKKHLPVSPNMIRRSQSLRQPPEEVFREREVRSTPASRRGSATNTANNVDPNAKQNNKPSLMQVLNQKIVQHPMFGAGMPPTGQQNPAVPTQRMNNYPQCQGQGPPQPMYQQITSSPPKQSSSPQPIYSQVYQEIPSQPIYQQIFSNNYNSGQQPHPGPHPNSNPTNANSNGSCGSPRTRRFSEELLKTTATFVQNKVLGNKGPPPLVTSKEIFVQTLNAKLSQMRQSPSTDRKNSYPFTQSPQHYSPQHQQQQQPPPNPKPTSFASKLVASVASHQKGNNVGEISRAFRVRQWISSRTVSDPTICRDSLMDQIREGKALKRTRTVNDRSSPKIYH